MSLALLGCAGMNNCCAFHALGCMWFFVLCVHARVGWDGNKIEDHNDPISHAHIRCSGCHSRENITAVAVFMNENVEKVLLDNLSDVEDS